VADVCCIPRQYAGTATEICRVRAGCGDRRRQAEVQVPVHVVAVRLVSVEYRHANVERQRGSHVILAWRWSRRVSVELAYETMI
jgi:hypothetical protein